MAYLYAVCKCVLLILILKFRPVSNFTALTQVACFYVLLLLASFPGLPTIQVLIALLEAIKNWTVGRLGNEARVITHGWLVNRKFKAKKVDAIKHTTIKHSKLRL